MKTRALVLFFVSIMVFGRQFPLAAQSCNIDLADTLNSLERAQALAENGEQANALEAITDARIALQELEAQCSAAIQSTDAVPLPQEFVMRQGAYFRINYPDGWQVVQQRNLLNFINTADTSLPPDAGGIQITMVVQTYAEFMGSISLPLPNYSPISVVQGLRDQYAAGFPDTSYSDAVEFETPRYQAASTDFASTTSEGMMIVVDLGAYAGLVSAYTAPDELAQWKPTIIAIINSIQPL